MAHLETLFISSFSQLHKELNNQTLNRKTQGIIELVYAEDTCNEVNERSNAGERLSPMLTFNNQNFQDKEK